MALKVTLVLDNFACPSEPRTVGVGQLTLPVINAIDCKYVMNKQVVYLFINAPVKDKIQLS